MRGLEGLVMDCCCVGGGVIVGGGKSGAEGEEEGEKNEDGERMGRLKGEERMHCGRLNCVFVRKREEIFWDEYRGGQRARFSECRV